MTNQAFISIAALSIALVLFGCGNSDGVTTDAQSADSATETLDAAPDINRPNDVDTLDSDTDMPKPDTASDTARDADIDEDITDAEDSVGDAVPAGQLVVYPGHAGGEHRSQAYRVFVEQNGQRHEVYVYTSVNTNTTGSRSMMTDANHWVSFDFEGVVTVIVEPLTAAPTSAGIKPDAANVSARVVGNEVQFDLSAPDQLWVVVPGLEKHPLFVYANPLETMPPPDPSSPNVMFFGPGIHTRTIGESATAIADGTEVYIAGGAFVEGLLLFEPGASFTVRGRGVLSGVNYPHSMAFTNHLIEGASGATPGTATIEGVTLTDGPHTCLIARGTSTVDNVKFMGWYQNTDALTVGERSVVSDVFVKVNDDNIKLYYSHLRVSDVTMWLQPTGSGFQMGWNTPREVFDVRVSGVDVIGCDRTAGTIDLPINNALIACRNLSTNSDLHDYEFRDFRVDCQPFQIMRLQTQDPRPSWNTPGGIVRDITLVDWSVSERPRLPILLQEEPMNSTVGEVIFDTIAVASEPITGPTFMDGGAFVVTQGGVAPMVFQ